jgi:peptidoglycan/LPS O-acetylase OafA/YrhL
MPANRIAVTFSYRPDIDGLRAVAVISVLLFHAFPEYVSGGFVGVDVFFVISGFLISNIVFNEIAAGSFSLRRFYARRVRRIFPALAVFLLFSVAAGWWILLPAAFREFGNEVAASALFFANIYFWFQSGYFSPDSQTLPLLHLWSLGVEEQFYIAWPIHSDRSAADKMVLLGNRCDRACIFLLQSCDCRPSGLRFLFSVYPGLGADAGCCIGLARLPA